MARFRRYGTLFRIARLYGWNQVNLTYTSILIFHVLDGVRGSSIARWKALIITGSPFISDSYHNRYLFVYSSSKGVSRCLVQGVKRTSLYPLRIKRCFKLLDIRRQRTFICLPFTKRCLRVLDLRGGTHIDLSNIDAKVCQRAWYKGSHAHNFVYYWSKGASTCLI